MPEQGRDDKVSSLLSSAVYHFIDTESIDFFMASFNRGMLICVIALIFVDQSLSCQPSGETKTMFNQGEGKVESSEPFTVIAADNDTIISDAVNLSSRS